MDPIASELECVVFTFLYKGSWFGVSSFSQLPSQAGDRVEVAGLCGVCWKSYSIYVQVLNIHESARIYWKALYPMAKTQSFQHFPADFPLTNPNEWCLETTHNGRPCTSTEVHQNLDNGLSWQWKLYHLDENDGWWFGTWWMFYVLHRKMLKLKIHHAPIWSIDDMNGWCSYLKYLKYLK